MCDVVVCSSALAGGLLSMQLLLIHSRKISITLVMFVVYWELLHSSCNHTNHSAIIIFSHFCYIIIVMMLSVNDIL